MGGNDHVTYHIWKYQKKGILMAYVSDHRKWFGMGFLKKEILMDYINIFGRHFSKITKKRKFDGLCKQVT